MIANLLRIFFSFVDSLRGQPLSTFYATDIQNSKKKKSMVAFVEEKTLKSKQCK